ncbi:methyltransferase domain-containing protein [bacterium]|nr:methyltransferase domain-containing protein [bacterium]
MLAQIQSIPDEINTLGECLLEANQIQDALALFELAASHEPDNGQFANNLAIARFQSGGLTGAVSGLETALRCGGDRRLFALNYADLARTRPRLLRRGLEVCRDYLEQCGQDAEVSTVANLIEQEIETAHKEFYDALAATPLHARLKVNGAAEPQHLVEMGEKLADCIQENLEGLSEARTVLDFGVGLGRVLWPLSQRLPGARFIGFDVDPMMLASLAGVDALSDTEYVYTTHDIPDNSVDAAYVISVFTHLARTTDYWLWELNRVLAPGGRAFITYHDETLYDELRKRVGGTLTFTGRTTVGRCTEGSTNMGTYYETREWERTVGRFFKIIRTVPRGLGGHQSFSVLEKGEARVDSLDIHRIYMRDLETELYRMRDEAGLEI